MRIKIALKQNKLLSYLGESNKIRLTRRGEHAYHLKLLVFTLKLYANID